MRSNLLKNCMRTTDRDIRFHGHVGAARFENSQHRNNKLRRTLHRHRDAPTWLQSRGNQPVTQSIGLKIQLFVTHRPVIIEEGGCFWSAKDVLFKQFLHTGLHWKIGGRFIPLHHDPVTLLFRNHG